MQKGPWLFCNDTPEMISDMSDDAINKVGRADSDMDRNCMLNTELLVQKIVEAKLQGTDSNELAYLFHQVLAEQIVAACKEAREVTGRQKVALSGGVFQNRLLLRLTEERLMQEGFEVLRHHLIPPNDGGIAIGQAAYGMHRIQEK